MWFTVRVKASIRRWRCHCNFHKWEFHTTVDSADEGDRVYMVLTTWTWCRWCDLAPSKVDIETRDFPTHLPTYLA